MVMPAAMVPKQSWTAMMYGTCFAVSHAVGFFASPLPSLFASASCMDAAGRTHGAVRMALAQRDADVQCSVGPARLFEATSFQQLSSCFATEWPCFGKSVFTPPVEGTAERMASLSGPRNLESSKNWSVSAGIRLSAMPAKMTICGAQHS